MHVILIRADLDVAQFVALFDFKADVLERVLCFLREHFPAVFHRTDQVIEKKRDIMALVGVLALGHAESVLPASRVAFALWERGTDPEGIEIFYHYGAPDPKNPTWQGFFEASEVNKYAKQLSEAGIEVVVIGFDYNIKKKGKNNRNL